MAISLGQQVGPLPLGGWVAVIGGGLGIAYFINRNQAAGDAKAVQQTESGVGTGGGQFIYEPPTVIDNGEGEVIEETNTSWGVKAQTWLIAQGHNPGTSVNAVNKFLSGENLSVQEQSLIDLVLVKLGPPPEPLPPVKVPTVPKPTEPAPTPTQPSSIWGRDISTAIRQAVNSADLVKAFNREKVWWGSYIHQSDLIRLAQAIPTRSKTNMAPITVGGAKILADYGRTGKLSIPKYSASKPSPKPKAKAKAKKYTVKRGDVLSRIALRYYGSGTKTRWMKIYNANKGTIESAAKRHGKKSSRGGPRNEVGWFIYPGTVLTIPPK